MAGQQVITGNNSSIPDQIGTNGKGVKRLNCCITLYIVGMLILRAVNSWIEHSSLRY